jgi:hypothetical protein
MSLPPPFRRRLELGLVKLAAVFLILVFSAEAAFAGPQGEAQLPSDENSGAINRAIKNASLGSTVIIQPGDYHVSNLVIPPGINLYAPEGATIIGDIITPGPQTTIRGLTFSGGTIDLSGSRSVSIGDCAFRGGTTAIKLDGASDALVINNNFYDVSGEVITGWGLERSIISGNHFFGCGQCINLAFNNDLSQGRGIVIERNIFKDVTRMPLEVGPIGAYTQNLVVQDNWATDFKNRGPDAGDTMSTFVAYSLVPTNGVNTLITRNYANAGSRKPGDIGIELAGSGEIASNHIENFRFGTIVYGADFYVHDNRYVNATETDVLNYAKLNGRIVRNNLAFPRLTPPERHSWP